MLSSRSKVRTMAAAVMTVGLLATGLALNATANEAPAAPNATLAVLGQDPGAAYLGLSTDYGAAGQSVIVTQGGIPIHATVAMGGGQTIVVPNIGTGTFEVHGDTIYAAAGSIPDDPGME